MSNDLIRTRIGFLPVAGPEDPGQLLRMRGVAAAGDFEVRSGVRSRFFAGTRTCLRDQPGILHFDWIDRYHVGRSRWVTLAKIAAFFLDVQIVRRIFRCPIVWTLHNLRAHEPSPAARWTPRIQRYFARNASLIRVFSPGAVARACATLRVERSKIRVVPEGDFSKYYPNTVTSAEARTRLGLAADDFVLLWLGSIRPYKGLHELIAAFRETARPHWRLVIAGKPFIPSYAAEIAALGQSDSRIRLHPHFIPENELQVFYNAADVVVLPFTEVENSGSVCMAMSFRKAVVAPDLGVIGERLHRQKELVYASGGLVAALAKLASLPAARLTAIGEANFAEITSYKWENLAAVFRELAATPAVSQ